MAHRSNLIVNALYRLFYRLAYVMCLVFGFVFRPRVRAVCVAAWYDDALLTIRQSYARKVTLPGGLMRRGEVPRDAAIRELREEVGLHSTAQHLEASLVLSANHNFKRETVHYFDLHYRCKPRVEVDRREVVSAHFSSVDDLTPLACAPQLRAYLAERGYPHFKR